VHLYLTDRLCCPRCGPEFGLILLARDVRERRVIEGELGCSNCRERYPVLEGFGDLRTPPRSPLEPGSQGTYQEMDQESTLRLAALLGVTEGPGTLLLVGPEAVYSGALADLIGQVEIVGTDPSLAAMEEREGVSRLAAWPRIPFFSDAFRGVLLSGEAAQTMLKEAARTVAPKGRVVIMKADPDTRGALESLGLNVLLEEEGVVVAVKERQDLMPLTPLRVS
jgi:uncharacterized protein YbaR (Trm112 family)